MFWIAVEEDCYLSDFEKVTESKVVYLMDRYKVDKNNPEKFHMQDTENGKNVTYEGVIYKGGFGYNLWVASKYLEL